MVNLDGIVLCNVMKYLAHHFPLISLLKRETGGNSIELSYVELVLNTFFRLFNINSVEEV